MLKYNPVNKGPLNTAVEGEECLERDTATHFT